MVAERVGHLTLVQGAATDLGRFVYEITFDPVTGQELSFTILSHAGQIGGLWSGPPYFDPAAFCALLTP
jgi:hypothetical protein